MKEYIVPEINVILFNVEDGVLTDVTKAESKLFAMDDILGGNDTNNIKIIQGVDINSIK